MLCKKITRYTSLILSVSTLFGCAVTSHGDGIVIAEQKTNNINERQNQIKHNAKVVGIAGAIGGGLVGGTFILWYGLMEGSSLASTLAGATIFAGAGALTFGLVGAVVGGSVGYYYMGKVNSYQYTVKSLHDSNIYKIKQYSAPIPLNTKVKVLERNGSMFIRKI